MNALRKLYGGPRVRDGTQVYAGMPVGGEGLENNWDDWIAKDESAPATFALESFRWMVHGDPQWPYRDYLLHPDKDDPYWQSPEYAA